MKVEEIDNKKIWEGFLKSFSNKTFLQSWNWGEFQALMGKKIWRLGIFDNNELLGACLTYKEKAKRGDHLIVPHGPIIKSKIDQWPAQGGHTRFLRSEVLQNQKSKIFSILIKKIKEIAEGQKVNFVRVAPIWERTEENRRVFKREGFKQAPMHIHAEVSWQINIGRPGEEILMDMRKNTRYYIRKAKENPEIKVEKGHSPDDLSVFNDLYKKTVFRHDFVPFSEKYLQNEVGTFSPDGQAMIFTGKLKRKPFVSAVIIFWQDIAFYHHGASLRCHEPVSYAVQWEIIKEAKKRGCRLYNLWGIADVADRPHPWWGLTLFKKGFGGKAVRYVRTQDLVISPLYWFNYGIETIRRVRRGF